MTAAATQPTTAPTNTDATDANDAQQLGGKYLTFKLSDEEYGVEILKVREINGIMKITAVPRVPEFVKGVINLRGNVIPVIDLRLKFGLEEIEHTEQTCIIVVNIGREIGIIVGEDIDPPPQMGGMTDTSFILGMGKVADAVKILLNIERVLDAGEVTEIALATENAAKD